MASLDEVLKRMDEIDWNKVSEIGLDEDELGIKGDTHKRFIEGLHSVGYNNLGQVLDIACGTGIFSHFYQDSVGLDIELGAVKGLRRRGIKAIHGDMRYLQTGHILTRVGLDDNCVDSVITIYPPVSDVVSDMPNPNDWESYEMDRFHNEKQPLTISKTWEQRMVQYCSGVASRYLIIHLSKGVEEAYPHHDLNPDFLKVYHLKDLQELDFDKSGKLLVMKKE